jgi:hypothetical protein
MASDPLPPSESAPPPPPPPPPPAPTGPSPFGVWLDKSGLPGKLMAGAAIVGIISMVLPLISVSASGGGISFSASGGKVIDAWQGALCLICYLAVLGLVFVVYIAKAPAQGRNMLYSLLGAGAAAVLFSLLLLIRCIGGSSGPMGGASSSPAIGTILNFLAAIGVGVGAFMKAREDKLF